MGNSYLENCRSADVEPEGLGVAGRIMGIIGTVLLIVGVGIVILVLALGVLGAVASQGAM